MESNKVIGGDGTSEGVSCGDTFGLLFSSDCRLRMPFVLQRAMQKAASERKASLSDVVCECLRGEFNLSGYVNSFDMKDAEWVHEKVVEAIEERESNEYGWEHGCPPPGMEK